MVCSCKPEYKRKICWLCSLCSVGEKLASIILKTLPHLNLNINDCRSEGYDGTAAVGSFEWLRTLSEKRLQAHIFLRMRRAKWEIAAGTTCENIHQAVTFYKRVIWVATPKALLCDKSLVLKLTHTVTCDHL